MKNRINVLVWLIVLAASYFCLAPTYRCDRGIKCSENGCMAQPGESTVGCTKILNNPYWTKTSEEPWPDFCHAYTNLVYTGATSGNWTGTDSVNCTSIEITNKGDAQLIFLQSVSNPYPYPLDVGETIKREINQEFRTIFSAPAGGGVGDGNVTIKLFK